jgi:hypothetical protein
VTFESSGVCVYKALLFLMETFLRTMSPEFQEYYQQLLAVLHSHEDTSRTEMEMIEACFKSSLDQWSKVCKRAKADGFNDVCDEIRFFKDVKPTFASYIEYYTFRYHAILFAPVNDPLELIRFWRWEEVKMQRFFEDNREFCRYIREGNTDHDAEFFRRMPGNSAVGRSADLIHDLDLELVSLKDPLLTVMKAYELYGQYIHQQTFSTQQTSPPQ